MTPIHEPAHLCVGTLVPEHAPLDLPLGTNRLSAFDRFGRQIMEWRRRVRNAAQRVEGEASNCTCGVVPGLGSHVRGRDDRPDIPAAGGKCALDKRTTDTL